MVQGTSNCRKTTSLFLQLQIGFVTVKLSQLLMLKLQTEYGETSKSCSKGCVKETIKITSINEDTRKKKKKKIVMMEEKEDQSLLVFYDTELSKKTITQVGF